jgi:transcription antitermination factor NusG
LNSTIFVIKEKEIIMCKSSVQYAFNWYAIRTHSRAEKKVYERLNNLGYETFLPLVTSIKQWSDRKKKVTEPLIKSFVFLKTSNNKFSEILALSGVVNVLKYLGKPAIVRENEIDNLKILVNNSDNIKIVDPISLLEGETVEVVRGPFKGLFATYINKAGKYRIIVEVEALQSFIEVNLPLNSIKKVANSY